MASGIIGNFAPAMDRAPLILRIGGFPARDADRRAPVMMLAISGGPVHWPHIDRRTTKPAGQHIAQPQRLQFGHSAAFHRY
jgi:hypothetical protein